MAEPQINANGREHWEEQHSKPAMKSLASWFGVLTVVSIILGAATVFSASAMKSHWHTFLAGEPLPSLTTFVLNYGIVVPIVLTAACVIGWTLAIKHSVPPKKLGFILLLIIFFQMIYPCIHTIAIFYPSAKITYRLGGKYGCGDAESRYVYSSVQIWGRYGDG